VLWRHSLMLALVTKKYLFLDICLDRNRHGGGIAASYISHCLFYYF